MTDRIDPRHPRDYEIMNPRHSTESETAKMTAEPQHITAPKVIANSLDPQSTSTPRFVKNDLDPDGFQIRSDRVTLTDHTGNPVWEQSLPIEQTTPLLRYQRFEKERRTCIDCGDTIPVASIYCIECRPYGIWHHIRYFSPRWLRRLFGT